MNDPELMDYEIDIFIRKYPYFTSLFDKLQLFDLKELIILYIGWITWSMFASKRCN